MKTPSPIRRRQRRRAKKNRIAELGALIARLPRARRVSVLARIEDMLREVTG